MRTIVLDHPTTDRYQQFCGAVTEFVPEPPRGDGLTRRVLTAGCGCVWRGLASGGGYSDGQITLCADHAVPEDFD